MAEENENWRKACVQFSTVKGISSFHFYKCRQESTRSHNNCNNWIIALSSEPQFKPMSLYCKFTAHPNYYGLMVVGLIGFNCKNHYWFWTFISSNRHYLSCFMEITAHEGLKLYAVWVNIPVPHSHRIWVFHQPHTRKGSQQTTLQP